MRRIALLFAVLIVSGPVAAAWPFEMYDEGMLVELQVTGDGEPGEVLIGHERVLPHRYARAAALEHDGTVSWDSDTLSAWDCNNFPSPGVPSIDGMGFFRQAGLQTSDMGWIWRDLDTGGRVGHSTVNQPYAADLGHNAALAHDTNGVPMAVVGAIQGGDITCDAEAENVVLGITTGSYLNVVPLGSPCTLEFSNPLIVRLEESTDDTTVVIAHAGRLKNVDIEALQIDWQTSQIEGPCCGDPVGADLDGDGDNEIVVAGLGGVWAFDSAGIQVWHYPYSFGGYQPRVTIGQLDTDTGFEIAVGDNNYTLVVLDHDGTAKTGWPITFEFPEGEPGWAAFGDFDDDGSPEIQVDMFSIADGNHLRVFESDGTENVSARMLFGGGPGFPRPSDRVYADLDGNGVTEIYMEYEVYACAPNFGGEFYIEPVETGAPWPVQWRSRRADSRNSGFAPR